MKKLSSIILTALLLASSQPSLAMKRKSPEGGFAEEGTPVNPILIEDESMDEGDQDDDPPAEQPGEYTGGPEEAEGLDIDEDGALNLHLPDDEYDLTVSDTKKLLVFGEEIKQSAMNDREPRYTKDLARNWGAKFKDLWESRDSFVEEKTSYFGLFCSWVKSLCAGPEVNPKKHVKERVAFLIMISALLNAARDVASQAAFAQNVSHEIQKHLYIQHQDGTAWGRAAYALRLASAKDEAWEFAYNLALLAADKGVARDWIEKEYRTALSSKAGRQALRVDSENPKEVGVFLYRFFESRAIDYYFEHSVPYFKSLFQRRMSAWPQIRDDNSLESIEQWFDFRDRYFTGKNSEYLDQILEIFDGLTIAPVVLLCQGARDPNSVLSVLPEDLVLVLGSLIWNRS